MWPSMNDGVSLYFSLQPNGSFAAEAGDSGQRPTPAAAAPLPARRAGRHHSTVQRQRHAELRAGHQRQPHHRRLQRGRASSISLTDSNGEYIDLTYNARATCRQLTDSTGQTETLRLRLHRPVPDQLHRRLRHDDLHLRHRPVAPRRTTPWPRSPIRNNTPALISPTIPRAG